MVQIEREVVETQTAEDGIASSKTVVNQSSHQDAGYKVKDLVYLMAGIIELLLLIRIILTLLGANRGNAFASFIYSVTYPIVAPFFGLFNSTFAYGIARLEVETLVAMLVVAGISWAIASVIDIVRK